MAGCRKRRLTSTTQLLMVESLKLKISWTSWPTRCSSSWSSQAAKAPARPAPGGESSSSKGARWCISGVGSIVAAARLQIAPLLAANVKSILGPGQRGVGVQRAARRSQRTLRSCRLRRPLNWLERLRRQKRMHYFNDIRAVFATRSLHASRNTKRCGCLFTRSYGNIIVEV